MGVIVLIENNDFSHYQLGIVYGGLSPINSVMIRNNTFHDQFEYSKPGAMATRIRFFPSPRPEYRTF